MSQVAVPSPLPARGHATPRWSVLGPPLFVPLSTAGRFSLNACVWVKPPLLASDFSFGSTLLWSFIAGFNPQVLPLSRL